MKKFTIHCTIDPVTAEGEYVNEDECLDLTFDLDLKDNENPVGVLMDALRSIPGVSGFCT